VLIGKAIWNRPPYNNGCDCRIGNILKSNVCLNYVPEFSFCIKEKKLCGPDNDYCCSAVQGHWHYRYLFWEQDGPYNTPCCKMQSSFVYSRYYWALNVESNDSKNLKTNTTLITWNMYLHPNTSIYSYSENPNKMQQCIKILWFLILNEAQHVSGDTPLIIRSLKLHKQPEVLHTWKVVGRAVVGRCQVAWR
jgi:hypothetical protein